MRVVTPYVVRVAVGSLVTLSLASTASATAHDRTVDHMAHKRASLSQMVRRNFPQPTFVTPDGQPVPTYQQWAKKSYLPLARGRITIKIDPAEPYLMESKPQQIVVSPAVQGIGEGEHNLFLHEMGHQYDWQKLGVTPQTPPAQWADPKMTALRQGWSKIVGVNRPWWQGEQSRNQSITGLDSEGQNPPGERFADDYSTLAHYGLAQTLRQLGQGLDPDLKANQWKQLYGLFMESGGYPLRNRTRHARRRAG